MTLAPPGVVEAPTDDELFWYLSSQKRWIPLVMTAAFALAALSMARFSVRSPWLWVFLVVLVFNVFGAVFAMVTGMNERRVTRDGHLLRVLTWEPEHIPSVDVFLPTCGEELAVLANTYRHVRALQWDGEVRVLVLDDAARPEVGELARDFGFDYLVRPNRGEMKKAGNLVYAFGESTHDVVAIFDADFCPRADYLHHLVPYLDDEQVAIVQSPQVFDTTEEMGWLQRTAGATQEYFYRFVQPSRDAVDAAICVGTNAIYRRSALATIGGFALVDHSEDVYTGVALLRRGYTTRYVPVLLAKGLCPDELGPFLTQQYRWCNGSITALPKSLEDTHSLTWQQRASFAAGFVYYITTALNVFAIHLPALIMAAFYPSEVRTYHYVPFLLGVWVYFVLLPRVFKTRWRFEVLRVQLAYSFSHTVAIWDRIRRHRAAWVPTGAAASGGNTLAVRIARLAVAWLGFATAASWLFVGIDVVRFGPEQFWPMAAFLGGYTYLAVPLLRDLRRVLIAEADKRRARATSSADAVTETATVFVPEPVPASAVVAITTLRPSPVRTQSLATSNGELS